MPGTRTQKSLNKVAALRKTDLFGNLSDAVLRKIAARAATLELNRGQILYSEHDQASGVYVVVEGELRSIRQSVEGREQVISTERAGAILAAAPVFNGGRFYSTMIANTASRVLCIEMREMHQLCHEHTEVLWSLARVFAHKVRHYAELIETLALRNVDQRVAQHLLTTSHERGIRAGEEGCIVELTLTRAEIANRLGSVREVVSRALTHLQKHGLIQMQGRRLVMIPNMHALTAFARIPDTQPATLVSDVSSEMS
jgi:CRP-like cAMP-binding protein